MNGAPAPTLRILRSSLSLLLLLPTYIHAQYNSIHTIGLRLLSFLHLLTFATTTQRRRHCTFSHQTKKSTNAQTIQRKTTVLVAFFFFFGWFSVNPLPISSVLVQNAGAARLLSLHSCLPRSYSAWVRGRTGGLAAHKRWKRGEGATRDDRAGRAGAGSTARSLF